MKDFSFKTREENIKKLKAEEFDLLIIGGGITGAGSARDAAMRGLKVALVEANDFAYGTSSRSSKLVHGGIRYLENLEFHLVFEALSERAKLFKIAPHLVHPLRFMIPLFKDSRVGMFKMGLGMFLYDLLALFRTPKIHERLNKDESLKRISVLKQDELLGSYVYSDGYMDDDRLVHETLRSANEHGACIANYVKVKGASYLSEEGQNPEAFGRIQAVEVLDAVGNEIFSVKCRHVVSSVGPWTDLVGQSLVDNWNNILRPTKGIHLTLPRNRLNLSCAVVMGAQQSNRIVFAIPRHEMIIIGTTDTDFTGNPEEAKATFEDVNYLINITNQYFPAAKITHKDIISSYVGVRPLVQDGSANEGKTSREHVILSDPRGLTFVAGGKYTTYRLMSQQIVDRVIQDLPASITNRLNKSDTNNCLNEFTSIEQFENSFQIAKNETEKKLANRYGLEFIEIIKKYGETSTYWQLEAYQAIHTTMCIHLVDFYTRRVPLVLAVEGHGLDFLEEISVVFKKELFWSDSQLLTEQNNLKNYINKELDWRRSFI